mmetsp:Transcript_6111/g.15766  ORF Transcript_6111/g.15766 Transcript_6111/m.15766 type:complete len:329 (+) Transcript_6111:1430-2416(+)
MGQPGGGAAAARARGARSARGVHTHLQPLHLGPHEHLPGARDPQDASAGVVHAGPQHPGARLWEAAPAGGSGAGNHSARWRCSGAGNRNAPERAGFRRRRGADRARAPLSAAATGRAHREDADLLCPAALPGPVPDHCRGAGPGPLRVAIASRPPQRGQRRPAGHRAGRGRRRQERPHPHRGGVQHVAQGTTGGRRPGGVHLCHRPLPVLPGARQPARQPARPGRQPRGHRPRPRGLHAHVCQRLRRQGRRVRVRQRGLRQRQHREGRAVRGRLPQRAARGAPRDQVQGGGGGRHREGRVAAAAALLRPHPRPRVPAPLLRQLQLRPL